MQVTEKMGCPLLSYYNRDLFTGLLGATGNVQGDMNLSLYT